MPTGTEGIPDWFEHQSKGDTVSFWIRKKIPSITCIFLVPDFVELPIMVDLFVNDYDCFGPDYLFNYDKDLPSKHAFLFDLELDDLILLGFSRNKWNHVKINWTIYYWSDTEEGDLSNEKEDDHVSDTEEDDGSYMKEKVIKILSSGAQMGIHVSSKGDDFSDTDDNDFSDRDDDDVSAQIRIPKEKSNTEGDVVFTNPYRRKFRRMPKKQREEILQRRRLEDTKSNENKSLEVSEIESMQQQHLALLSSGKHNLVHTETKEELSFVEVGVSETETAQRCSLEETKSDEDKSLEVSETEIEKVILSIAQMRIH